MHTFSIKKAAQFAWRGLIDNFGLLLILAIGAVIYRFALIHVLSQLLDSYFGSHEWSRIVTWKRGVMQQAVEEGSKMGLLMAHFAGQFFDSFPTIIYLSAGLSVYKKKIIDMQAIYSGIMKLSSMIPVIFLMTLWGLFIKSLFFLPESFMGLTGAAIGFTYVIFTIFFYFTYVIALDQNSSMLEPFIKSYHVSAHKKVFFKILGLIIIVFMFAIPLWYGKTMFQSICLNPSLQEIMTQGRCLDLVQGAKMLYLALASIFSAFMTVSAYKQLQGKKVS